MVGKGYEVSVFDVAPNVPDRQASGCQLLLISGSSTALMAVPDASTVIAVSALALWDCRPMDCIEIAFSGGGGRTAMVRVGHSDEL
ncbi:hypothetical protein T03_18183 [Trichinella britovi]|uniref:Uncharacterized protein n=1 Tax=Trichinella britovi TaxID=45882 RepID=A0A0V1C2U8_TRIBR|nr:hypothetical protein T03_18183 [Trichinella britovi]